MGTNVNKTVLVVEDEPELLTLIALILRRAGCHVHEARTPDEAILLCKRPDFNVDLILSDFNLPQMNGMEFARKVELDRPDVPVVIMSGNDIVCNDLAARGVRCLKKPFTFPDMEHTICEILGVSDHCETGFQEKKP